MHDRLALCMVETLEVHALQVIEHPDGAGLRQECGLIDEAPEGDETVQGAGLAKVLENAGDAHHGVTSPQSQTARASPRRTEHGSARTAAGSATSADHATCSPTRTRR